MSIYKAYDIRGTYPKEVNEEIFEKIGNVLRLFKSPKKVVIGSDMRSSSEPLKEATIKGLRKAGISVIDIGLSSTPMLYQASSDLNVDMGIIITASHNPKEYNGMKICFRHAYPMIYEDGIELIEKEVSNNNLVELEEGELERMPTYYSQYEEYLKTFINPKKQMKITLDCGNGMGGHVDSNLLSEYVDLSTLYCELDGNFPNHEANPIKEETMGDLKARVLETNSDFGMAFDGDADRVGFIDEKGNFVPNDLIAALLTEYEMKKHPGDKNIGCDIRSSKIMDDVVKENGGNLIRTRIGHSYIKKIMHEKKLLISSELSGHFFLHYNENLLYDSALRSAIEMINLMSERNETLSEAVQKLKKYIHSPETNFIIKNKTAKMKEIREKYSDATFEEIDGVYFYYDNWWANIRPSNTEDILRLNLEANNQKIYDQKMEEMKEILEKK